VDQSSPDFLHGTRGESHWKSTFSDFWYLDPFRRYSRSKFEIVWNRAEFCMFLAPNFFGGRAPEFLDLRYKERPYCDYVAKFCGDRPTELGGCPANKKKHLQQNIRPPGTNVPGGLIITPAVFIPCGCNGFRFLPLFAGLNRMSGRNRFLPAETQPWNPKLCYTTTITKIHQQLITRIYS